MLPHLMPRMCVQLSKKKGRGVKLVLGGGKSVPEQRRQQALQQQVRSPSEWDAICSISCFWWCWSRHARSVFVQWQLQQAGLPPTLELVVYGCRLRLRATMGGWSAHR